jgi:hypothetical protein
MVEVIKEANGYSFRYDERSPAIYVRAFSEKALEEAKQYSRELYDLQQAMFVLFGDSGELNLPETVDVMSMTLINTYYNAAIDAGLGESQSLDSFHSALRGASLSSFITFSIYRRTGEIQSAILRMLVGRTEAAVLSSHLSLPVAIPLLTKILQKAHAHSVDILKGLHVDLNEKELIEFSKIRIFGNKHKELSYTPTITKLLDVCWRKLLFLLDKG